MKQFMQGVFKKLFIVWIIIIHVLAIYWSPYINVVADGNGVGFFYINPLEDLKNAKNQN